MVHFQYIFVLETSNCTGSSKCIQNHNHHSKKKTVYNRVGHVRYALGWLVSNEDCRICVIKPLKRRDAPKKMMNAFFSVVCLSPGLAV